MDREKLLGAYIDERIAKQQEAARKAYREEKEDERKRGPFRKLADRNNEVIRAVTELTAGTEEYKLSTDIRKKVVVVIGKHPETDLTPDHTVVCGVTKVSRPNRSDRYTSDHVSAEFAYAIVPTKELDRLVSNPHHLHNTEQYNTFLFDPEESLNLEAIEDAEYTSSRLFRGFAVRNLEREVIEAENNLDIVLKAVSNADLNPHLQPLPLDVSTY